MDYAYIGLLRLCELGIVEIPFTDYNGYKRIETSLTGMEWSFEDEDNIVNMVPIVFPEAKTLWGNITHFGIFTEPCDGRLVAIGSLTHRGYNGKICEGLQIEFAIGGLRIAVKALEVNNG